MLIDQLIISEEITVLEAMNQLEKTGRQILFIAPDLKLKGVVVDADIRRHIIHGGSLEDKISLVANYNPKYLGIAQKSEATEYMIKKSISALPLLDNEGNIVEIAFYDERSVKSGKSLDLPVVIMAGGLGTRLYPYTKILPKPLIPVGEKPIVEHIIDRFAAFGCKNFNMIVNHKKHMIKAYFNELKKDYNVDFTDEEVFLGTGGGLSLLKGQIDSTFFLTNCDVLIEADYNDIWKFHKQQGNIITVVCAFKHVTINSPFTPISIASLVWVTFKVSSAFFEKSISCPLTTILFSFIVSFVKVVALENKLTRLIALRKSFVFAYVQFSCPTGITALKLG